MRHTSALSRSPAFFGLRLDGFDSAGPDLFRTSAMSPDWRASRGAWKGQERLDSCVERVESCLYIHQNSDFHLHLFSQKSFVTTFLPPHSSQTSYASSGNVITARQDVRHCPYRISHISAVRWLMEYPSWASTC